MFSRKSKWEGRRVGEGGLIVERFGTAFPSESKVGFFTTEGASVSSDV
jgi:hypothetical protein